jgi:hypothetical protein
MTNLAEKPDPTKIFDDPSWTIHKPTDKSPLRPYPVAIHKRKDGEKPTVVLLLQQKPKAERPTGDVSLNIPAKDYITKRLREEHIGTAYAALIPPEGGRVLKVREWIEFVAALGKVNEGQNGLPDYHWVKERMFDDDDEIPF